MTKKTFRFGQDKRTHTQTHIQDLDQAIGHEVPLFDFCRSVFMLSLLLLLLNFWACDYNFTAYFQSNSIEFPNVVFTEDDVRRGLRLPDIYKRRLPDMLNKPVSLRLASPNVRWPELNPSPTLVSIC